VAQLGLALHTYEFAHEAFPPGVTGDVGPIRNVAEGKHVGWIIRLLPFMEQNALEQRFTPEDGVYAASNTKVREARIEMLECPSSSTNFEYDTEGRPRQVAVSNYVGCHHDVEAPIDANNHGMLFLDSRVRFSDIADGSSHTLLISERRGSEGDLGWTSGTRATLRNTSPFPGRDPNNALSFRDDPAPQDPLFVGGFDSHHAGHLVVAGLADGAIRSIFLGISPDVLRQLGNRADGEVPTSDY
jgi:hypothetical protein